VTATMGKDEEELWGIVYGVRPHRQHSAEDVVLLKKYNKMEDIDIDSMMMDLGWEDARNALTGRMRCDKPNFNAPQMLDGQVSGVHLPAFDFAELEERILQDAFPNLCGDCIGVNLKKEHDPAKHNRRVCSICYTVWPGAEPWNRRHEAIEHSRALKAYRESDTNGD